MKFTHISAMSVFDLSFSSWGMRVSCDCDSESDPISPDLAAKHIVDPTGKYGLFNVGATMGGVRAEPAKMAGTVLGADAYFRTQLVKDRP